jgi:hypothetical protein
VIYVPIAEVNSPILCGADGINIRWSVTPHLRIKYRHTAKSSIDMKFDKSVQSPRLCPSTSQMKEDSHKPRQALELPSLPKRLTTKHLIFILLFWFILWAMHFAQTRFPPPSQPALSSNSHQPLNLSPSDKQGLEKL